MKPKSKEEISSLEPDPVSLVDSLNCDSRNDRYIDLEASRKAATRALNLAKEHLYPKGEAYACMNLATGHFLRSENKEALEYCSKSLKYFKDHSSEPGYADALTCIGNIYESFGEYETALEYCQNAFKICEEIKYREGFGEVQSVLGLIYTRLSDFELALEAYKQSLQIREELGDQRAVASSLNRIARTYTLKKQYEQALSYYNKSLRIRESLDQKEAIEWTYLGFASTYEDMGVMGDAQIYYQKILETAESRLDDRLKLQALLGMGRTFSKLKMETEALQCFEDSLALAIKLKAKPLQGEAHYAMAEYFETLGSFERALVHYKDYLMIQEEVLNDETRNRFKNQQIAFAVEKSEREREIFQLRNVELKAAYDEIQRKNQQIADSIDYASRIQSVLLPHHKNLAMLFPEHFVLYMPKNIVSGDFYWAATVGNKIIFTAADCTGHGVPGALMSMLGISFLNEIIVERGHTDPGEILGILRREVIRALKQKGAEDEQHEGIDMALCSYDTETGNLTFAGAINPLYLIRNSILKVYKADRMPVCYYHGMEEPFKTTSINLEKGDQLYLFSDGYVDQFGGPLRKKLKLKVFQELLITYHQEKMEKQKELFTNHFLKWKGNLEQYDDVLLLGIKI